MIDLRFTSYHGHSVVLVLKDVEETFWTFSFRWFPQTERSRAVGIAMAGFQLGSAIGLTLAPILMSQGGIFGPFVIFGLSGFLWVLVWISATSSTPDQNPQISKSELDYILNNGRKSFRVENQAKRTKVIPPFRRLLSKPPTWSLIVANAMHSWVLHTYLPLVYSRIALIVIWINKYDSLNAPFL